MEVKAKGKYFRISPKKMRLVTNLIKGMDIQASLDYLNFVPKKASLFVSKVLKSALTNAEHNFNLKKENLFIKEIFVNQGPTLKRWRPRAFGRAGQIRKRSSHLEVILEEKKPVFKSKRAKPKLKEPVIEPISESVVKTKQVEKKQEEPPKSPEKYRPEQHSGKLKGKRTGGVLKRIFRRKSF